MRPPERWLHGSRPACATEPTSRRNRPSTCPSAPGGRAPGPGATDGMRAAHARPPRRSSGCLGLDLGCPRRLLPAARQMAAQRAASRCCCWRPLTSARRPPAVVGGIVANFEHLWGRGGVGKSRSRAHRVPVSGPERRGRIARRSRWRALAAAATHEPHTIVSASRRRPRGSPRSSASDEGVARNRLPSAEKATSGGPGGQRRPRSGRARHEGGVAALQGGEGIGVPFVDLAKEKERPRSPN